MASCAATAALCASHNAIATCMTATATAIHSAARLVSIFALKPPPGFAAAVAASAVAAIASTRSFAPTAAPPTDFATVPKLP